MKEWLSRRWVKRVAVAGVTGGLCFLTACAGVRELGGAYTGGPGDVGKLSPAARELIAKSFADLGAEPLVDYHAHIVGTGRTGNGAEINPSMFSWRHPVRRVKAEVYLSACGVDDIKLADEEYLRRFVSLVRGFGHPLKVHILALDHYYNADGSINREKSEFYVPNELVVKLAEEYPDIFVPVISVHPYRTDALEEIEKWAGRGVCYMKWLPNAQGIDPADPRIDDFYRLLKKHDIVLLSHTGKEMAVEASEAQEFGNPLRLRRPLDLGVKVIAAHCGSLGRSKDLDHPGAEADNVELFYRLMGEERYRGLLFADISATTQLNRVPQPLLTLLERPDLQGRLVNGSDYPLPAINCVISTRKLEKLGMLTKSERSSLKEIYNCNPLLFDYVLKRTVHSPATGNHISGTVFTRAL